MKISLNWIKQFVEIPSEITPEKLAELLTLKTVEVEGIEKQGENLDGVVVGKILEVSKHSDADKLHVCKADIGEAEPKQIVCGGINLKEGIFVAIAKIGAKVKWHGEGELVEIKKTKIRGVESEGMICASSEIGLDNLLPCGEGEIIKLNPETRNQNPEVKEIGETEEIKETRNQKLEIGTGLSVALGLDDVILEADNKSLTNRPDLWGHLGIAREVAAILGVGFQFPVSSFSSLKEENSKAKEEIKVKVESPELCKRYMAVIMSGIKIGQSPEWMQKRLLAVGMRPINCVVDATNYVMIELGQPLHAFDKSKVESQKSIRQLAESKVEIIVRTAKEGEVITTLDGVERVLDKSMLVIACLADGRADMEKAIAIAGVMGGENSEIDENTTDIIIESANFDKVNNRKTSSKLGLRTEASMRFEKGLDPNLTEQALARCVDLIKQIIPEAEISSEIADVGIGCCASPELLVKAGANPPSITVDTEYINKKIGIEIPQEKIVSILESLGFNVENFPSSRRGGLRGGEASLQIGIPSWRATGDISIPEDIIEEIARIYGYDNIQPQIPDLSIAPPEENKERKLIRKIKNILSAGFGMAETSNYSFVGEKQITDLGMQKNNCIKLANPLSSDLEFLRPNLAINLLKNTKDNLRFFEEFKMFEIGSIFKNEEGLDCADPECAEKLPWQEKFVGGIFVGGKNSVPFYEAKNIVEGLCESLGVEIDVEEDKEVDFWKHPCRKSKVESRKSKVNLGYVTELNPVVAKNLGIKNARVAVFELSIKSLMELSQAQKSYKEASKFPAVLRDIALVVKKAILAYNIISTMKQAGGDILKEIELFDYYEGDKIGLDKKSLAFHLVFQSDEKTLGDNEVDEAMKNILSELEGLGAELRK